MPFITEEIYHLLDKRSVDLCVRQAQPAQATKPAILEKGLLLKNAITGIRDVRNRQQIKPKETISLHIQTAQIDLYQSIESILGKQINSTSIQYTQEVVSNAFTTVIGKDTFYIESLQPIDTAQQKEELLKELNHLKGFLQSVEKKLSNEKFVQNAKPEVLALEQKKQSDALAKIQVIEESLTTIG